MLQKGSIRGACLGFYKALQGLGYRFSLRSQVASFGVSEVLQEDLRVEGLGFRVSQEGFRNVISHKSSIRG